MIASPALSSALKAAAVATGMILLFWAGRYTAVGAIAFLLVDGFIAGPLRALGWVSLEDEQSALAFFTTVFVVIAGATWLCIFWLFFRLFQALAERKARAREAEEYE